MSNLTQYKIFIGDDKKNMLFGVTYRLSCHQEILLRVKSFRSVSKRIPGELIINDNAFDKLVAYRSLSFLFSGS